MTWLAEREEWTSDAGCRVFPDEGRVLGSSGQSTPRAWACLSDVSGSFSTELAKDLEALELLNTDSFSVTVASAFCCATASRKPLVVANSAARLSIDELIFEVTLSVISDAIESDKL